ncbi:MAG: anhydro-N-acetylmuramic acid kinase [Pseudomonadota bacterium]
MPKRRVAGLISGTSMDGLDIAIVDVEIGDPANFALLEGKTVDFPADLQQRLRQAHAGTVGELTLLDDDLGRFLAVSLDAYLRDVGSQLDLVGSHGQTIFHEHRRATLQIGEPSHMALTLGCPVVSDFRRADIVAGGCGAPLAPILDKWILSAPDKAVLALNLGGIANFTALPSLSDVDGKAIACDTGPSNMVMDGLVRRFTQGRQSSDLNGAFAARGQVRQAWLDEMLADPYFQRPPPKSCGDAEFGDAFVEQWLVGFAPKSEQDWFDLLATATELSAVTIAQAYERFVAPSRQVAIVAASGGGVRNPELMRRLQARFGPVPVVSTETLGLDPDLKEAIAFALMASARIDGIPANIPEVTGADRQVLLGKVTEVIPREV